MFLRTIVLDPKVRDDNALPRRPLDINPPKGVLQIDPAVARNREGTTPAHV
jgi:hypothetical protein